MFVLGEWDCKFATVDEECEAIEDLPEFEVKIHEKVRFRLINAGSHAMMYFSIDQHTLNVTEADSTAVYGRECWCWFLISKLCLMRLNCDSNHHHSCHFILGS